MYIGGTGRSGSTLLARLLTGVPGVVAVGELRYVLQRGVIEDHLCGCGLPFRKCLFWKEILQKSLPPGDVDAVTAHLKALAHGVDRNRYIPMLVWPRLRTPGFRRRFAEYTGYLGRLYAAIAEVSGESVIVDSSKDPSYAFVLHAAGGVDLSLLHLIRDSRAVAFSWTRPKLRPEVHSHVAHMATRSPARSGVLWTGYHLLFEWLERHVRRYYRVRYEDFVAEPERVLAEITQWLQAGVDVPVDSLRAADVVHDISGNPLRFDDQPLRVSADEEWTTRMPRRAHRIVTLLTGPLLRRYGYRRDAS